MTSLTQAPAANLLAALSDALASIVEAVGANTLAVEGRHSRSLSSALLREPGVVATVAHVFRRTPAAVSFVGADGNSVQGTFAGADSTTDIAAFRLDQDSGVAARLGEPRRGRPAKAARRCRPDVEGYFALW